jgi:hypothetical protein
VLDYQLKFLVINKRFTVSEEAWHEIAKYQDCHAGTNGLGEIKIRYFRGTIYGESSKSCFTTDTVGGILGSNDSDIIAETKVKGKAISLNIR